jgi:uncharacterized membrane protein YfcA
MDIVSIFGASPAVLLLACAIAILAGLVKGLVGFAMPMVLISGLSSVVPADVALGWLILPTLVTNSWQAMRQGFGAALASLKRIRTFLLAGVITLLVAAQLVVIMPGPQMLLLIGVPISIYAALSLLNVPLNLPRNPGRGVEAGAGAVAGFFGGISGVWGPPTVALLTALGTEKTEQVRILGVVFSFGMLALVGAHVATGVFNAQTASVSTLLVLPGVLGIWIGFQIQDRIDQTTFRRLTLFVLLVGGLNLIRRGVLGL